MDMDFCGKNIVFLGIGGISMSALARIAYTMGATIMGTDMSNNENIEALKHDKIAKIKIGNSPTMIRNADIVVYTSAINQDNPDLQLAHRLHKVIYERATMLGIISCKYKQLIAISGTHGKTTTTSLLGWIMYVAGLNPTVHIGGISQNFNSNIHIGSSKYFITEACEYKKSFLHLNPNITIINNIELDHPDCYKNYNEIKQTFVQLSRQTKDTLIINGDVLDKTNFFTQKTFTFGLKDNNDIYAQNIQNDGKTTTFDVIYNKNNIATLNTTLLGRHNIYNILASVSVALLYNIDTQHIKQAIESFVGTKRRYEVLYNNNYNIILDYAHHPSEIRACIDAALAQSPKRIIAIFQPHTYSRTLALMQKFATCWQGVDILYILPTYAAREKIIPGGRAIDLFYNIKNTEVQYISNKESILYILDIIKQPQDTILWLGAGDIENLARKYAKTLLKNN